MTDRRGRERRADVAERTLPHSLEAERALLGAVMVNPSRLPALPPTLRTAFYRDAHRRIYAALLALHDAGAPVDLLTLMEQLRRTGELDEAGGPVYLSALIDGVPSSAHVEGYAAIVSAHAVRREVIHASNRLLAQAYEAESSPDELVGAAHRAVLALTSAATSTGRATVASLIPQTLDLIERTAGGHAMVIGTPTGFRDLDELVGGMQRGDLTLLAGRPSQGKTSLAMNIAERAAEAGRRVLVFSLEMQKEQLMMRLVCGRARVDWFRLRSGFLRDADYGRVAAALAELGEMKMSIDDTASLPIEDLHQRARKAQLEDGALDLVVVDYLQLVTSRQRHDGRTALVTTVSQGLKALAKELDVPVLALSQLNRAPEHRKGGKPELSDLRESGSLEQDADVVLFVWRPSGLADEDDGLVKVIVGKQRNGPAGVDVTLVFLKQYTRFENSAEAGGSGGGPERAAGG